MWLLNRQCPHCKNSIPLGKRVNLISSGVLKCEQCLYILQPTIMWSLMVSILIAPILYFSFYNNFKSIMGSEIATILVIALVILCNRILEPLASLKAHDENELL